MNHATQPKNIDIEHLADLHFIAFFHCGKVAYTSVIDQYINATEMLFSRFYRFLGLLPGSNI